MSSSQSPNLPAVDKQLRDALYAKVQVLEGQARTDQQRLAELEQSRVGAEQRYVQNEQRLNHVETENTTLKERLSQAEQRLVQIEGENTALKERLAQAEQRSAQIEAENTELKKRVQQRVVVLTRDSTGQTPKPFAPALSSRNSEQDLSDTDLKSTTSYATAEATSSAVSEFSPTAMPSQMTEQMYRLSLEPQQHKNESFGSPTASPEHSKRQVSPEVKGWWQSAPDDRLTTLIGEAVGKSESGLRALIAENLKNLGEAELKELIVFHLGLRSETEIGKELQLARKKANDPREWCQAMGKVLLDETFSGAQVGSYIALGILCEHKKFTAHLLLQPNPAEHKMRYLRIMGPTKVDLKNLPEITVSDFEKIVKWRPGNNLILRLEDGYFRCFQMGTNEETWSMFEPRFGPEWIREALRLAGAKRPDASDSNGVRPKRRCTQGGKAYTR
ncbi:hypothetical protein DFJ77DRAFT_548116 [Powellomyces hirtus]|nr:hypothetical protein DFJ77DRAFT_548116 [Powellomyces hirtus]